MLCALVEREHPAHNFRQHSRARVVILHNSALVLLVLVLVFLLLARGHGSLRGPTTQPEHKKNPIWSSPFISRSLSRRSWAST